MPAPLPIADPISLAVGVELRHLRLEDAGDVAQLVAAERARLDEWMEFPLGHEAMVTDVTRMVAQRERGSGAGFVICVQDEVVGECRAFSLDEHHGTSEFGYWLAESHTGQGIGRRALAATVEYVFTNFAIHRAEVLTSTENVASRQLAERVGFQLEGVRRSAERVGDKLHDQAIYGLLRDEWSGRD